jgi:hypothetical protein
MAALSQLQKLGRFLDNLLDRQINDIILFIQGIIHPINADYTDMGFTQGGLFYGGVTSGGIPFLGLSVNARYGGPSLGWNRLNTTVPAMHVTFNPTAATLELYSVGAGANPLTWTNLDAWVAPTLLNSWVNYNSGFTTAGYWKDIHGVVHIKGLVASGTIGSPIFQLPAGFRPIQTHIFSAVSLGAFAEVRIDTSGNVTCISGNSSWLSLDGIMARTF